ncbi:IS3 family transposase [Halopseudomonas salina]|uniref:Transposase n=1 Tax=Halopseudomonas salina TaxID=1323744 RepID=A0ABQ1Q5D7_9GAMM|nr:IS3 family transposase [Halopseudomonas salina]GGD12810.1 transposase [Halopseudomonas salina]
MVIAEYLGQYPVTLMCRALNVSRSGFYKWHNRKPSPRQLRREQIEGKVVELFAEYKARYGAPRLAHELKDAGLPCSKNFVANIMRYRGIRARNGKGFHYRPASPTMINVEENRLRRRFHAEAPNQKWVTDITYIWVKGSWAYLATVMDLYSRAIVGWKLDTSMTEKLVLDTLTMAFSRREVNPGLIIHSDRGVQFRSVKYLDLVRSSGCLPSMSRQGNCWDNAVMESFYSRLKVELIYAEQYGSMEEVRSGIFEYIEIFYNRKRRHSALGNISPAEFERRCA